MKEPVYTAETKAMTHLFEHSLRRELQKELAKLTCNDVFVDVGACVGTSCLLMEKGTCYAFEFDPDALTELRRNISLNPAKKVVVVESPVADRVFNYEFHKKRMGDSFLTETSNLKSSKTVTLDSYFKGYRNIKLIKVDAEGQDYNVLLGASRIIRNNRPVIFAEAWNPILQRQIIDFLTDLGYQVANVGINVVGRYVTSKRRLEVTTMAKCVVDCAFCPQTKYQANYRGNSMLTLERFKMMVDRVPKDVVIEFAGFSEPFLNADAVEMVKYVDNQGYRIILDTTLTGLTPQGIAELKDLDIIAFSLHLPDNKENAKIPASTQNYKDTLTACLTNLKVDSFSSMNDNFVSNGRAGNCIQGPFITTKHSNCRLDKIRNPQPVVLPNGNVYLCCMDFSLSTPLGNLLTENYDEIVTRIQPSELCHHCVYSEPLWKTKLRQTAKQIYDKYFSQKAN